jgi:hypothetical protein
MTDQVNNLGVILDKKFDWKEHLENRMRKACIAYWRCRCAVGKTWGLLPKVVAWLYTSMVRPILSYASLVWWKRVKLKNAQKWLFHMQRMTSLGITGGMRSTLTSALEVMLKLPPLHLFIKQVARQAANRLLGNGCSYVPNFGHLAVLIKMTDEMPLLLAPRDNLCDSKYIRKEIFCRFPYKRGLVFGMC